MTTSLTAAQTATLVALWAAYAGLHSLLASLSAKRWVALHWPAAMPAYRLAFNLLALLLLAPPLWLTFAWGGAPLWQWQGGWAWVANGLALAALAAFVGSLRYYDMSEFSGGAQWRTRAPSVDAHSSFRISPLHRYVRHPWYALGLVILWTRDMDEARLVSTVCVSLYLWLGSMLEERKLLQFHGEAYARYRQRVAALVPLPGRILSAAEADELAGPDRNRVSS